MANSLYEPAIDGTFKKQIDWVNDDIRAVPVKSTYTFSSAHQFLSSISGGDRTATPVALTNKTFANRVFNADDVSFPAASVTASVTSNAVVLFVHTGSDATAKLLGYVDTAASGLPVSMGSPAADINVAWSNGSNSIFKVGG